MSNSLLLEPGPSERGSICECCGTHSTTVHGFIYDRREPFAIYYAGWSSAHPERGVTIAIATGKWSEGSTSADRVSIGIDAHASDKEIQFSAIDAEQSPWGETELFGKMLDRIEAVHHPRFKVTLEISELVAREDQRIHRALWR